MLRVLAATALLLVLGSVLALAAPGLSTRTYMPEAVEFDLAAPPAPAGVAARSGFVADALRTPKRFNLVGFSWRGGAEPAIALRTRTDGGDWTRWTPVGEDGVRGRKRSISSPVWVGEADWIQYRMSRRVAGLRLHFVNTLGTATAADRVLTRLRRVAHTATVAVAPAWGATVRRPRIHTRGEWGAEQCPTRGVDYGSVRAAVVHHTVTANAYSRAHVPAAILAICRFHRNTNGWNDIGYNFVVDRFGGIWEGRAGGVDEAVMGAHAQGYNAQTTGISNLGTYSSYPQSEAAMTAMAKLIRWKLSSHGIRSQGTTRMRSAGGPAARYPAGASTRFHRVSGHRDTGTTECPGEQLYRQLPELRERIGERLPAGAPIRIEAELPPVVSYSPDGVPLSGRLVDGEGLPVAGGEVLLQRLGQAGWRKLAVATSDTDGNFTAVAKLKTNTALRWKFAGDATYRIYRGDGALVQVAPAISAGTETPVIEAGDTVEVSGTTDPPKTGTLMLLVERDELGVWERVGRKKLKARSGAFKVRRRFDNAGSYRLSILFGGDSANAPATSPYVDLAVEEPIFPFR